MNLRNKNCNLYISFKVEPLIFFLLLVSISLSCKDNSVTPAPAAKVFLEVEDVSCTEAWVNIKTENISLPAEVTIYNGDTVVFIMDNVYTSDTTVYIDSLLVNHSYEFYASVYSSGEKRNIFSSKINFTTLDITSDEFTFQTWSFGDGFATCTLRDAAIIDQNNIYVVGSIYLYDSIGQPDLNAYNLLHWNGSDWELLKIQFYSFCGQAHTGSYPTSAVKAFSANDIWISCGSQITHYDGTEQLRTYCVPVSTRKIWGTREGDLYAGGVLGKLARFSNGIWKKIDTGTEGDIFDVWGTVDSENNKKKVFCTVSSEEDYSERYILTLDENNNMGKIVGNERQFRTVWSSNGRQLYTGGGGLFSNKSGSWGPEPNMYEHFINKIRGNGMNDIFAGGNFGLLAHFNGMEWKKYIEFRQIPALHFYSIDYVGNVIAAVGMLGDKGVVVIGVKK